MAAGILAVGVVTPVGLDAASTAASVRAGGHRLREVGVYDAQSEPVVTARLDDASLPPLSPAASALGVSDQRETRLLRLAGPALREATARLPRGGAPLLLAVPEPWPGLPEAAGPDFLRRLSVQAGVDLDLERSRLYPSGRAGGLSALADALALVEAHRASAVIVGGVDTYDDVRLLQALIAEGRLQASGASDRLIPGEGAAFLVVGAVGAPGAPPALVQIDAVGQGFERGHLYSAEPYRGEGLAQAFAALFAAVPASYPEIQTVYASFNGEGFWAKEWGVGHLRHRRRFAEALRVEHPADCFGDGGAALGPTLLALAAIGVRRGYRRDPCLVFCSSDRGARAAALVSAGRGARAVER